MADRSKQKGAGDQTKRTANCSDHPRLPSAGTKITERTPTTTRHSHVILPCNYECPDWYGKWCWMQWKGNGKGRGSKPPASNFKKVGIGGMTMTDPTEHPIKWAWRWQIRSSEKNNSKPQEIKWKQAADNRHVDLVTWEANPELGSKRGDFSTGISSGASVSEWNVTEEWDSTDKAMGTNKLWSFSMQAYAAAPVPVEWEDMTASRHMRNNKWNMWSKLPIADAKILERKVKAMRNDKAQTVVSCNVFQPRGHPPDYEKN